MFTKSSKINIVQNFWHVENKSIFYRPGIYNLQTRVSTFPDQGKLLERENLRYLKKLKAEKVNTKIPQIKHSSYSKYVMIYRPDWQTWFTTYRPEKTAKKITKNWNWPFLISQLQKSLISTLFWNERLSEKRGVIYRPEL